MSKNCQTSAAIHSSNKSRDRPELAMHLHVDTGTSHDSTNTWPIYLKLSHGTLDACSFGNSLTDDGANMDPVSIELLRISENTNFLFPNIYQYLNAYKGPSGPTISPDVTLRMVAKILARKTLNLANRGTQTPFKYALTSGSPDPTARGANHKQMALLANARERLIAVYSTNASANFHP